MAFLGRLALRTITPAPWLATSTRAIACNSQFGIPVQPSSVSSRGSNRLHSLGRYPPHRLPARIAGVRTTCSAATKPAIKFCSDCGGPIHMAVPQGERELRAVCTNCHRVHYQNPKMVVGCIVEQDARILLCRRAIEPCKGLWTLPAGFMELQESSAEGAARETREETGMEVRVLSPFAHLDIPVIGQSYIIFRAEALPQAAGPPCSHESLEVAFFPVDEIPFDQLAFSAVRVALHKYVEDLKRGTGFGMHHGVIHRKPGAHPADANGFEFRDVLTVGHAC